MLFLVINFWHLFTQTTKFHLIWTLIQWSRLTLLTSFFLHSWVSIIGNSRLSFFRSPKPSFNWNRFNSENILFFFFQKVRKSANSTLLYLIENGFLDKKVINRTVCPVILDLLKIDKTEGANGENDIQLNAIGVSVAVDFGLRSWCSRQLPLRRRSNRAESFCVLSIRKMATLWSARTARVKTIQWTPIQTFYAAGHKRDLKFSQFNFLFHIVWIIYFNRF